MITLKSYRSDCLTDFSNTDKNGCEYMCINQEYIDDVRTGLISLNSNLINQIEGKNP